MAEEPGRQGKARKNGRKMRMEENAKNRVKLPKLRHNFACMI